MQVNKFDYADKWYIHKPESIQENKIQKILWTFEIRTYHPIPDRWLDLVLLNKKIRTCNGENFAVSVEHKIKIKENKKIYKYLDLAWELKKLWNMKVTVITIVVGTWETVLKGIEILVKY